MIKFPYMSPDDAGGGGGGTTNTDTTTTTTQVTPADARVFLNDFVSDPKSLETMKDEDVVAYHGRVSESLNKHGGKWEDKWREKYAGGDEKKLNRLTRYASPTAALDALLAAQNKISESGLKEPFPDKGTAEQQAAWREANGIPPTADKYDLTGLPVTDENKERVNTFLAFAHGENLSNKQVSNYLKWSAEAAKKDDEELVNAEKVLAEDTQEKLRADWGTDYKPNMNKIHGLLDMAPAGVKDGLLGGRMADGTPIFANPDALRFLANIALELNPASTLVPATGGDMSIAVQDEMQKLEKLMANKTSEYWKGPTSAKLQERYRLLADAKSKLVKKGKAA